MTEKKLSELTDQELLIKAKKMKSTAIINALLVGFLIGIIIFSVVKSTLGLFTLIPLFLAYKLANQPTDDQALKTLLKERNLEY